MGDHRVDKIKTLVDSKIMYIFNRLSDPLSDVTQMFIDPYRPVIFFPVFHSNLHYSTWISRLIPHLTFNLYIYQDTNVS